jgi:hypothetical protein
MSAPRQFGIKGLGRLSDGALDGEVEQHPRPAQ